MTCKKTAGQATLRHNDMISIWCRALRSAGCSTSLEPLYIGLMAADDVRGAAAGQRRGDILTTMPDGRVLVLDCVITHPAAASYVREASRTTGWAAEMAEQRKWRQFQEFGRNSPVEFKPLAGESYGRIGKEAARFIKELGDIVEASGRGSRAVYVRNVRAELSCALCRGNARMYYSSLGLVAQRVGRGYRPGCEVPCEDLGEL